MKLKDGTEATLRYMEPKDGELVNQGPYWEGSFEREGQSYYLTLPLADPSGDIARRVLSSMVEVSDKEPTDGGNAGRDKGAAEGSEGPAPGYNLVETPDGGLSAEVPQSWDVETGEDSEKEGVGIGSWSYHAGEYIFSSITVADSLEAWYGGSGESGAYFVASEALARYSDYEITHSLLNANKGNACAEAGPYEDYERGPLSGKLQAWYGCGQEGATVYTLAAAPEGRGCVVALNAKIADEAERETIEHLVDTLKVDCGRVTSGPPSSPSATASPEAAVSPEAGPPPSASTASASSASASAGAQGQPSDPAYDFIVVPRETPPCPLGLDQVRATYGPDITCGEGGGYVPASGE